MGFNDKQQHLLLENENSLYALVSTHKEIYYLYKEIYYLAELYEFLALSPHLLFSSPPWLLQSALLLELGWHAALLRS